MEINDKISRSSLHVEVTDRLREMIYERNLLPGERIDELGLSARLGTSRTPLREALKVLAHEGLVRLVPGRGAFVIELDNNDIEALFPVLGLLQGRCAGDAVRNQQAEDVVRLDQLHQHIEQAALTHQVSDYHRAVDAFHERLQAMAANPWLSRSITDLRRFLQMVRNLMPPTENRLRQSMAEFRTLMKAVQRGDADAAEQLVYLQAMAQQRAWRAHLANAQQAAAESAAQGASPNGTDAGAHASHGAHTSHTQQPAQATHQRPQAASTPATRPASSNAYAAGHAAAAQHHAASLDA